MPKDVSLSKQLPNNGTGKPSSPQKNEITVGCTSSPPQRKSLSLSLFPPLLFLNQRGSYMNTKEE